MLEEISGYINLTQSAYHDNSTIFSSTAHHYHDIILQFAGTLYNTKTLKRALSITEDIDTALLIAHAYKKWGIALLNKLDGIFAFVLWDKGKNKLYLAKDHVSIKPLFYYMDKQSFLFSSSLKSLSHHKNFNKRLNHAALANYFTYGYILQPNTIYTHCYKVKSGHYVQMQLDQKNLQEVKYWDLGECYDKPKLQLSELEFKNESARLLELAVKKRLENSTNYAASLSGGYDSSTIAAFLQAHSSTKIKTFTIGFEHESINEAPDAKKIAEHLGTDHTEYYFSAKDALKIIPQLSDVFDEPFYDNGSIPTTLLATMAYNNAIETIFAGDGGDEVFATADDIERFDGLLSFPQNARNLIFHLLHSINPSKLPYFNNNKNFPTKYYKFLHILKAQNIPEMVKVKMTLFHPYEIKKLILDDNLSYPSIFDEIYFGPHAQSVDKVIGSYFKTFMTDGELIKTTRTFASQNIDIRTPYLDKSLIAFMAQVPTEIKIKNGVKKNLLKQVAHDYIPKTLLDRPKKGFSVPFSHWMKHELHALLMDTLSENNLKKDGILDPIYVSTLKNAFLNGKEEYKYKLWSILLYQLWYEKNIR